MLFKCQRIFLPTVALIFLLTAGCSQGSKLSKKLGQSLSDFSQGIPASLFDPAGDGDGIDIIIETEGDGTGSSGDSGNDGSSGGDNGFGSGDPPDYGDYDPPQVPSLANSVFVNVTEQAGQVHNNLIVTFSHVFRKNIFFDGKIRVAHAGTNEELVSDIQVLRYNKDSGSIQHAIVTVLLPSLKANETVSLRIDPQSPALSAPAFIWPAGSEDLDPEIQLTGKNGSPNLTAKLSDVVTDLKTAAIKSNSWGEHAYFRTDGKLRKDLVVWLKARKSGAIHEPIDISIRMTFLSGVPSVKTEFVIENTRVKLNPGDTTSTFSHYDIDQLTLKDRSTTFYSLSNDFTVHMNTRKRFQTQIGSAPANYHVSFDAENIYQARYLPRTTGGSAALADFTKFKSDKYTANPLPNDLMFFPNYMGQTGGAEWIGPATDWILYWLSLQSVDALEVMETIESNPPTNYPVYMRQSPDASKHFPGGPIGIACTFAADGSVHSPFDAHLPNNYDIKVPHTPDTAHTPNFAIGAYVATGDLWYEEQIAFWAIWAIGISDWPEQCALVNNARAAAWTNRNLNNAAFTISNTNPRYELLQKYVTHSANMYKERTVDTDYKIHVAKEFQSVSLSVSGRKNYINATRFSPWMYSWLCWSFQLSAKRDYSEFDALRDWLCQWVVEAYTVENDPNETFYIEEWNPYTGTYELNSYHFPAEYAMWYNMAVEMFDDIEANSPKDQYGNPLPCDETSTGAVAGGFAKRRLENWGEVYYRTLVNNAHRIWPEYHLCTNGYQYFNHTKDKDDNPLDILIPYEADGKTWSIYNGFSDGFDLYVFQRYGGEPGAYAIKEAIDDLSASGTTGLDKGQAQAMWQRYLQIVTDWEGAPQGIDLSPGILQ